MHFILLTEQATNKENVIHEKHLPLGNIYSTFHTREISTLCFLDFFFILYTSMNNHKSFKKLHTYN